MAPNTPASPGPTRRDFGRAVAVGAAASLAAVAAPAPAHADDPPKPAAPTTVSEALAAVVRLRFGKHLSDEQLTAVQGGIARSLAGADRLAKLPLKNSDEPAVVFRADLP
jgi:hypothetical protein